MECTRFQLFAPVRDNDGALAPVGGKAYSLYARMLLSSAFDGFTIGPCSQGFWRGYSDEVERSLIVVPYSDRGKAAEKLARIAAQLAIHAGQEAVYLLADDRNGVRSSLIGADGRRLPNRS